MYQRDPGLANRHPVTGSPMRTSGSQTAPYSPESVECIPLPSSTYPPNSSARLLPIPCVDLDEQNRNYIESLQTIAKLAREDLCTGAQIHQQVVAQVCLLGGAFLWPR